MTATLEQPKAKPAAQPPGKVDNTVPDDVFVENAIELRPLKFTYRVQAGSATFPVIERDEKGRPKLEPVYLASGEPKMRAGKPVVRVVTRDVVYGPKRPAGDVVEWRETLEHLNPPKPLPPKFVRIDADGRVDPNAAALAEETRRANALRADRQKLLERMSLADLREYAESEGLDVGNVTKKEELIRRINAARPEFVA